MFDDNYKYDNIIYNTELDYESPRIAQPIKIKKQLKPHQLACVFKATMMENVRKIKYSTGEEMESNIGILGDIVGYGKTLTALSIIAHNDLDNIFVNNQKIISQHSTKKYNYFKLTSSNKNVPVLNNMINSTLIIVPRGPVYIQWEKTLSENTDLKYLAIDNLNFINKYMPKYHGDDEEIINYFNQYDVVLIKNTTLTTLFKYYDPYYLNLFKESRHSAYIYNWKRVIIDECHDIINKIETLTYLYLWLISGTYLNICDRIHSSSNSLHHNIKEMIKEEYLNFILVKCNKEFVRQSFNVPPIVEKFYLCKMSKYSKAIIPYINQNILEKINANDISGAIKDLGGKNETEAGIANLICADMNKAIHNKYKEMDYIALLDIPDDIKANKLNIITIELKNLKDKLKDLTERISEIENKTCAICLDNITHPIILDCTHIFCGTCIINLLNTSVNNDRKRCPNCRTEIKSTENLTAIVPIKKEETKIINRDVIGKGVLSKEDTLIELILNNKSGKFIVFSRVDAAFSKITEILTTNNINHACLKGNTNQMMNILNNFKYGNTNVILLTTQYAGSGIDISIATDVIILHSMDADKQQAIGRAQRVGRIYPLNVHNLCYEHEMNTENTI
jgi:superfamily II DNA or RNA helicase